MFRDKGGRERAAILERWRAASGSVPTLPAADAVAPTQPRARALRVRLDESALFAAFEAELRTAVAEPLAGVLSGWLGEPRDRFREQPTGEHRAALLASLDRIEDVLAAVLLTSPRRAQ